jgi:hypothetical protein
MKKLIVVLAVFLVAMQVSAIELLDGFTTDMGINEVRQRARVVLRPRSDEQLYTKANFSSGQKSYFFLFEGDKEYLNSQFPVIETVMVFESSLPVLFLMFGIENYRFYFYRDKLFAIRMVYGSNRTENFLSDFTKVYGNSYVTIDCTVNGNLFRNHVWETAERAIFLGYSVKPIAIGFAYYVDRRNINFSAKNAR